MKKTSPKNTNKNPTHVPRNGEIILTSKLRLKDAIMWDGRGRKIQYLINNHPIELWNRIHNKNKSDKTKRKVSLVRPAYALLKSKVKELEPSLVEKVNKQHDNHNARRRLNREISKGLFGSKTANSK